MNVVKDRFGPLYAVGAGRTLKKYSLKYEEDELDASLTNKTSCQYFYPVAPLNTEECEVLAILSTGCPDEFS